MLIDHSSAVVFSPGITTNTYKYYNKVAKQVQQPSIVQVSITRCHSTKLAGALLPNKKSPEKSPVTVWHPSHLHPRWRPSLFWVPSHPVFSSLVLQADWTTGVLSRKSAKRTQRRGHYTAMSIPTMVTPSSLTARPWKMMVGRILSYWEGIFLRGELLNFGRVISGSYWWFTIFNQCLEDHPTFFEYNYN